MPCHAVTVSSCHRVTLSPCHLVTLSPCHRYNPSTARRGRDMPDRITPAIQDYLKTIHGLGGAEHTVSPVDIAAALEVKAPSVTGMLKRLVEAGLVKYETGQGVRLTDTGIAQARRVIRRHRLV